MSVPRVTVVHVGKVDAAEVEAALARVAKVLRAPVAMRQLGALPRAGEDPARGQHETRALLGALRAEMPRTGPARVVGAAPEGAPAAASAPEVVIFVTDADLFAPATDAVMSDLDAGHRAALLSVRRLREVFYRRKADPARQKSRLAKEILRLAAGLAGLRDCPDAACACAPTRSIADLDRKAERYCAPCWKRLSEGTIRV